MNIAKNKKTLRITIAAAVIIALILGLAGARAANILPSKDEITLKDSDSSVTFDVTLESDKDFAGAEFGLKPSSSDVELQDLTYSSSLKNEANVKTTKNGVFYFGFFAGSNKFKAGKYTVATLTYTYSGDSNQSITLDSSKIVTIDANGKTTGDTSSKSFSVSIKRVKTAEDPDTAKLRADLEKAKKDIENLQKELEGKTAELDKITKDLEKANSDNADLKGEIDSLKQENSKLKAQLEELQKAKDAVDKQLADLKNSGSASPAELEKAKKDLAAANDAKANAEKSVEYLKGKLDEATKMLDKVIDSKTAADKELGKTLDELERLKKELNEMQKKTVKAPAKPAGIKAKAGKRSVTVSWNKVKGASGYKVYQAAGKNSKYKLVKTTGKTKVTVKKLKKGKTYYYKVNAYKNISGGQVTGSYSKAAKAKVK